MGTVINVRADGTAVGDGVANDTLAIQTAIDEVDIGGTVVIPHGVYKVTKNDLHAHTTDYGTGYSAIKVTKPVTIEMEGAVIQTVTGSLSDAYGVFWGFGTTEIHINGGMIIGSALPTDGEYNSRIGVLIEDCDHCSVNGLYLRHYSQGINVYSSDYCTMRNVDAELCKGSGIINFMSRDSLIEHCTAHNCYDGTISLFGGGRRNTVRYCRVSEDRYDNRQGITLEKEIGSTIYKNRVKGCYYGIDVKNASDSCTIEGNYTHFNQHGITIRDGDPGDNGRAPSNNIRILGNNTIYPKGDWPNYGIHVQTGSNHLIEGNTVRTNRLVYKTATINTDSVQEYGNVFTNNNIIP